MVIQPPSAQRSLPRSVTTARKKVSGKVGRRWPLQFLTQYPGHRALDCKDNRVLDMSRVPDKNPDDAWTGLQAADAERDLDEFREVCQVQRAHILGNNVLTVTHRR